MAADLTGWVDSPHQALPPPDWIIVGTRDETGVLVTATYELDRAQHDSHFDGYEEGPEVHGLPARQPRRKHMLGVQFTRSTVVHAPTFHGAIAKLLEVWRPE